jgi:hypothetical protein
MNIYLAGPMRGIVDGNEAAFAEATAKLRALGHKVFNPGEFDCEAGEGDRLRKVFAADLVWISAHAEAIALLPGWENSKGATAEAHVGFALGIQVAPVEEFLDPVRIYN